MALFGVTILGERSVRIELAGDRPHRWRGDTGRAPGISGAIAASISGTATKTSPQLHQSFERRERPLVSHGGQADQDRLQADERDAVQGRLLRVTARHRHEQLRAIRQLLRERVGDQDNGNLQPLRLVENADNFGISAAIGENPASCALNP
jgi:hypothetical protein